MQHQTFAKINKNLSVYVFGVVFGDWYGFGIIYLFIFGESNSRTLEGVVCLCVCVCVCFFSSLFCDICFNLWYLQVFL